MIIIFSRGQMSNHLFQYMYLVKQARAGEKVIVIGMTELFQVFEKLPYQDNIFHLSTTDKRWIRAAARFAIDKSLSFFARRGLISSYQPRIQTISSAFESEAGEVVYNKGFFSFIAYARGNFQSPLLSSEKDIGQLVIDKKHLRKAEEILVPHAEKKLVFVHIRRGDYLTQGFRPLGQSAVLPDSYYLETIASYSNDLDTQESLLFVVVTDDLEYTEALLLSVTNKIICSHSMPVDFSLMSLCDGGILSASSFSYWGAMLAIHKNSAAMNFYAPKYWLGFRSKEWFPVSLVNTHLEYVDVINDLEIRRS